MNVHKQYDKCDNDTYVEKLGNTPYHDVLFHMFRDPNGFIETNGVRGNFTADSVRVAENYVLQFPKSTDCGMIRSVEMKASTLYPMSMVARYDIQPADLFYTQKAPIYYDADSEMFVLFMDIRFLRDMNINEIQEHLRTSRFGSRIVPYSSARGGRTFLGVQFKELSEIKLATDQLNNPLFESPLHDLYSAYTAFQLSVAHREKVIVIRVNNSEGHLPHLFGVNFNDHSDQLVTAACLFEYAVAYKVGGRYHLLDEDGTINKNKVLHAGEGSGKLIECPYSYERINKLETIKERLVSYQSDMVEKLFSLN